MLTFVVGISAKYLLYITNDVKTLPTVSTVWDVPGSHPAGKPGKFGEFESG